MARKRPQLLLFIADTHTGGRAGLTHPQHNPQPPTNNPDAQRWYQFRTDLWNWFNDKLTQLKKQHHHIDALISGGDLVDGPQPKSEGRDTLLPQTTDQIQAATTIINHINARQNILIRGTQYHVADTERQIAQNINAHFGNQLNITSNNTTIHIRHHINGGHGLTGLATPLATERLKHTLKVNAGQEKDADILIRAHAHKYTYQESNNTGQTKLDIGLPSLSGPSEHADTRCSGPTSIGFIYIITHPNHQIEIGRHLLNGHHTLPSPTITL